MIIVYTGEGKGKTSACAGQALRAIGRDLRVLFGQFIKRPDVAGEQEILARLLENNFYAGGIGFLLPKNDAAPHAQAAAQLLAWALERLSQADMIILDEAIYALDYGLIDKSDLDPFLAWARNSQERHLVLSGCGAPAWLLREADIVTRMECQKHAYADGTPAIPGVEF